MAPNYLAPFRARSVLVAFGTPERLCGNEANLRLADDFWFRPSTMHIVLGADLYSEIMLPGFQPSRAGSPIAQNTVFGWIFSGACAHQ
ncbi:hypothetical protein ACLKA7_012794 [Drosophila subpalustris]